MTRKTHREAREIAPGWNTGAMRHTPKTDRARVWPTGSHRLSYLLSLHYRPVHLVRNIQRTFALGFLQPMPLGRPPYYP